MEADSLLDVHTPVLENMVIGVPPVFEGLTRQLDTLVEEPLLGPKTDFPAGWTPVTTSSALHIDWMGSFFCICP